MVEQEKGENLTFNPVPPLKSVLVANMSLYPRERLKRFLAYSMDA